MAESRVQLPLGAFDLRVWESLVIRVHGAHEIVGSGTDRPKAGLVPAILTPAFGGIIVLRWVLCWYGKATVNRRDAGSIPATAALDQTEGQPTGDGNRLESGRTRERLEGSTPSPSAPNSVPLADRQRHQPSKLADHPAGRCPVRLPQGTLSGA